MIEHLQRLATALDVRPAELAGLLVLLATGTCLSALLLIAPGVRGTAPAADGGVTLVDPGPPETPGVLVVHVAGAVRRPGVVRLPPGSRVADAIDAAGGARVDAILDALNLAAVLEDGERVHVPGPQDAVAAETADGATTPSDSRVDLNRASAGELEQLPGIGPVLAQRIVSWREQHGPFRQPGDLRAVPGIGERTFQALADLVRV